MMRHKHKLSSMEASIEHLTGAVDDLKGMLTTLLRANNLTSPPQTRRNLCEQSLRFKLVGKWLDPPKDARTTTDPYVRIVRPSLDPGWLHDEAFYIHDLALIWQSEVQRKSLMPNWAEAVIDLEDFGGADMVDSEELVIQVFDWERSTPHDIIGSHRISIGDLIRGEGKSIPLFNTVVETSRSGIIVVNKAVVVNSSELKSHSARRRAAGNAWKGGSLRIIESCESKEWD